MSSICIQGAEVVTPLKICKTRVLVEGNQIIGLPDLETGPKTLSGLNKCRIIDGSGCYLTPGLIDLQVNGSSACNLWANPTAEQFEQLRRESLRAGVTSFLPTLITGQLSSLQDGIEFLIKNGVHDDCRLNSEKSLARVPGIHLEGPFLSPERFGVHPKEWLSGFSLPALAALAIPPVRLMTLAPELAGGSRAIKFLLEKDIRLSLGHSNASFDQAEHAFALGVSLVTHVYNALVPFHHRAPGALTAALLNRHVTCMVIADGLHVHPAAIELLLKCKTPNRTILVSDAAWRGTRYGELVGSSITVADAVMNMVKWKLCTFAEAIKMASYNPAAAIGIEQHVGQIAVGKKADLLLWDKYSLKLKSIIFDGRLLEL